MKTGTRMALLGALIAGAALVATHPAEAHGVGAERGMPGARGGAMLDFDAVAGPEATEVDRETLTAFGVERLRAFDLDGDGLLDREEIAAAMPARERPRGMMVFAPDHAQARAERLLAAFGEEPGGSVPVEAVVEGQVDRLFDRLDRDEDGVISREEAERGMRGRAMRAMSRP